MVYKAVKITVASATYLAFFFTVVAPDWSAANSRFLALVEPHVRNTKGHCGSCDMSVSRVKHCGQDDPVSVTFLAAGKSP
jgi:hypothetical protein